MLYEMGIDLASAIRITVGDVRSKDVVIAGSKTARTDKRSAPNVPLSLILNALVNNVYVNDRVC